MRSICSDGAKVGANFRQCADEKVTIALFLGALFKIGRSAADDLGGSNTTSLKMAAGNAQNSNLLFSKVGLVQSLSNLSPEFLMLEGLNPSLSGSN
jgi:hypothetical protein